MKPDEIHLNDWLRIIFGEVPPSFYVELFIRAALVYLMLLISMRLLGKRMAGQISRLDMAAMTALASAIGVSMLSPVNGLLPPLIIAIMIVGISRLISYISVKNENFEKFTQGELDMIIENGVLKMDILKKVRVSRERLFAQLRSLKIGHLGKVDRMYMEADGNFSVIPNADERPGLLVLPDWDDELISYKLKETDTSVCKECGEVKPADTTTPATKTTCTNCGKSDWTMAVLEK